MANIFIDEIRAEGLESCSQFDGAVFSEPSVPRFPFVHFDEQVAFGVIEPLVQDTFFSYKDHVYKNAEAQFSNY